MKRVLTNRRALSHAPPTGSSTPPSSELLLRPSGAKRLDDEPWSLPELVLVDEAEAVLNGVGRTYGHAVVDEAQDLSAMELRAVARRCPSRSMTVLGDLAQATAPGRAVELGPTPWCTSARHPPRRSRSSSSATGCPGRSSMSPTACCRRWRPACGRLGRCASTDRLRSWCRRTPERPAAAHRRRGARPGRRLVVGGPRRARAAGASPWPPRSREAGVDFGTGTRGGLGRAVTLLDPPEAKGLEFDAVVVVEPSAIHTDERGGRLLYIALTRAVQALAIVHADPLPAALAA